jgi:hypothetical protein
MGYQGSSSSLAAISKQTDIASELTHAGILLSSVAMIESLRSFILALGPHAAWFLTNVVFGVDPILKAISKRIPAKFREPLEAKLDQAHKYFPGWLLWSVSVLGVFVASYLAYNDEFKKERAEFKVISGKGGYAERMPQLEAQLRVLDADINGKNGYVGQILVLNGQIDRLKGGMSALEGQATRSAGASTYPALSRDDLTKLKRDGDRLQQKMLSHASPDDIRTTQIAWFDEVRSYLSARSPEALDSFDKASPLNCSDNPGLSSEDNGDYCYNAARLRLIDALINQLSG